MISPVGQSAVPQALTQSTPQVQPKQQPQTTSVEDRVTLSSAGDKDHDGDSK
jgi:hypothetical protein